MCNLFHADAFDEFRGEEVAPGADKQSNAVLEADVREACDTVYHSIDTCKMDTDPMAVVNPELQVHGVEELWVVNASIMPTTTADNTNAPTTIIGEKTAEADLIESSRTQQSLLTKYNVKSPAHLVYLVRVDDLDW